jgi:hypothetical protein
LGKKTRALHFAAEMTISHAVLLLACLFSRLRGLVRRKNGHLAATLCGVATEHHAYLVEELIRTHQFAHAREVKEILVATCAESTAKDIDIPDVLEAGPQYVHK